jgi:hypothetical protein
LPLGLTTTASFLDARQDAQALVLYQASAEAEAAADADDARLTHSLH